MIGYHGLNVVGPLPQEPGVYTKLQFLQKFTTEELTAIKTAAKTDVSVEVWLWMFDSAQEVRLSDPNLISGIDNLVTLGLLTEQRRNEILEVNQVV